MRFRRLTRLLPFLLVPVGLAAAAPRPPNILFIYTDDQSYKTLSCYDGAPSWVSTPRLDGLAAQGVRFARSYLGAWCSPSRASILTGRLQHGVTGFTTVGSGVASRYDPAQCRFLPAEFRRRGYHTAQIGKWHTGDDTGFGRDWDHQIAWNAALPTRAGGYYGGQTVLHDGRERAVTGYSTDNYTGWAVDYLRARAREPGRPWYLWLCYGAIHGPTTPAPRHRGKYAGRIAPAPADIFGPWPGKPAYLEKTRAWMPGPDGRPALAVRPRGGSGTAAPTPGLSYDAWIQQVNECLAAVDEGVGRLLEALDETGQRGNTLVVFAADQGHGLGEHGFNQKVAAYDATVASPLILAWPGRLPAGRVCAQAINAPDLMEYLCGAAGVRVPWKTHGRDLRPLVADPERAASLGPMLMTHTSRSYGEDTREIPTDGRLTASTGVPWYALLRLDQFKYVRTLVAGETEELYDLAADPEELTNLAGRPEHAARLRALREATIRELRRTEAGFVDRLPPTRDELAAAP